MFIIFLYFIFLLDLISPKKTRLKKMKKKKTSAFYILWCFVSYIFVFLEKKADGALADRFLGIWQPRSGCMVQGTCCCIVTRLIISQTPSNSVNAPLSIALDGLLKCSTASSQIFTDWLVKNGSYASIDMGSFGVYGTLVLADDNHMMLTTALNSCPNYFLKDGFIDPTLTSSTGAFNNTNQTISTASTSTAVYSSTGKPNDGPTEDKDGLNGTYVWTNNNNNQKSCIPNAICACGINKWYFDDTKSKLYGTLYGGWGSTSSLVIKTQFISNYYYTNQTHGYFKLNDKVFVVSTENPENRCNKNGLKTQWCDFILKYVYQEAEANLEAKSPCYSAAIYTNSVDWKHSYKNLLSLNIVSMFLLSLYFIF